MEYTKPELNLIGAAEGLVLGDLENSAGDPAHTRASSAFEFEE
jgi:hypothetical protein